MRGMPFNLSKPEVRDLVYSYESEEVTNQLYDFGKILLGDVERRSIRINSQSTTVLGWATAVLAFLFAFANNSKVCGLAQWLVFVSALLSAWCRSPSVLGYSNAARMGLA
jgi:hypothetical protein